MRTRGLPALDLRDELWRVLEGLYRIVLVERERNEARPTLLGLCEERLVRRIEDAVASLELCAVDREVCLMDELIHVVAVTGEARDAHRDGRADRFARRLDVEHLRSDRTADAVGYLERLRRGGLGQQDRELLAAEPCGHVVVAELLAEDVGDAAEHGVTCQMAVGVVDVAKQVEVGHDQRHRPLEPLGAAQLLVHHRREVAGVVEAGLRVDSRLGLELGNRERAVDEQKRRERERDQPRVQVPERSDREAERGEDEVGREALE